jgi:hypothetical protein
VGGYTCDIFSLELGSPPWRALCFARRGVVANIYEAESESRVLTRLGDIEELTTFEQLSHSLLFRCLVGLPGLCCLLSWCSCVGIFVLSLFLGRHGEFNIV